MQQLIKLINQNFGFSGNVEIFFTVFMAFGLLFGTLALCKVIKEKNTLTNTELKTYIAITITAFIVALVSTGFDAHQHYVIQNQIKANNVKIEQIEKTTISSQASKYPYCVSMKHSSFWGPTQVLMFFNNQQNAINFIKKNQNSKHIFLSNYLRSDSCSYLSQGSNQSIENNFDQMQVKSTKTALTQMINESKNNE